MSMPTDGSGPGPAPIPPGYKAGDYVPFADRDPANPSAVAGQWADPARQAQVSGQAAGRKLTDEERYRAIYGYDAPVRVTYASWGRRVLGYLVDSFFGAVASIPVYVGWWMVSNDIVWTTDLNGNRIVDGAATDVSGAAIGMLVLGFAISLAFGIWNVVFRQGRTGYTLGKAVVGISGSSVPLPGGPWAPG